jgi:hypothetical protein
MKAPWHFWLIAFVSLLWNAVGGIDYFMTQSQNEAYMSNFTPEQLSFFYGFPTWVNATWAIGVWFAVLGSILLLLRNALAIWAFAASLVGMVLTAFHNFILSDISMLDIIGVGAGIFTLVIFLVAVFLLYYARAQKIKAILV